MQLVVDSSRQILYSRTNNNTISVSHTHLHWVPCDLISPSLPPSLQVYDLGKDGRALSKVTSVSVDAIAHRAAIALQLRTPDKSLFKPLVSISVIPSSESSTLHLLAVSHAGGCGMGVV